MPKTKYYEDEMVKKTFRFPQEICEWLDQKTNTSEAIRDIIDAKLKISQKRNVPAYVLPKRPHRGRPRKDEKSLSYKQSE